MRQFFTYDAAVALISLVALGTTIWLCIKNRTSSATVMGGVFVAAAVVSQLSSFKSFKAFTIEAQLQDRIDRADELIKQLRALSILTAKAGYTTTSFSTMAFNGMSAGTYGLTNDFNELIASLHLSESEVAKIKQPEFRAVAYRLYFGFFSLIAALPGEDTELTKNWSNKDFGAILIGFQSRIFNIDNGDELRLILSSFVPDNLLPLQRQSMNRYIDRLVRLYEDCIRFGGPTKEFIDFDHEFSSVPSRVSEVAKAIIAGADPK